MVYLLSLFLLTCGGTLFSSAENEPHEGKRKVEGLWPIFRLHHQRSRYVFDLYYKRSAISKELLDYCIKQGLADGNLIAKWRKVRMIVLLQGFSGNMELTLPCSPLFPHR
jgi:hypothetical protein